MNEVRNTEAENTLNSNDDFFDFLKQDIQNYHKVMEAANPGCHPSDEMLYHYVINELDEKKDRFVREHISFCEICLDEVVRLTKIETEIENDILEWANTPEERDEAIKGKEAVSDASKKLPGVVKISQWLKGIFEQTWEKTDAVLDIRPAYGMVRGKIGARRAKKIDLNTQAAGSIALVVNVKPEPVEQTAIRVQVYPVDQKYLPAGLILRLEIDSETEEDRDHKDVLGLEFSGEAGEAFKVHIVYNNQVITEHFMI